MAQDLLQVTSQLPLARSVRHPRQPVLHLVQNRGCRAHFVPVSAQA